MIMLSIAMIMTIIAFGLSSSAESPENGVNALEYEDESPEAFDAEDSGDLVSEDSLADESTIHQHINSTVQINDNPDTGVEVAVIPAAAALIVLVIMMILKKKKK
jgi:hypothetical protein